MNPILSLLTCAVPSFKQPARRCTALPVATNSSAFRGLPGLLLILCLATPLAHADPEVVAWGDNSAGQTNVPPGLSNAVAVAAGKYHSLALRADGSVAAWGEYWDGTAYVPTSVPVGLSNVIQVASGDNHLLALINAACSPVQIVRHPSSRAVPLGADEPLFVLARGTPPLRYQWRLDGADIPGATHAVHTVTNIQSNRLGQYAVRVANECGAVVSSLTTLSLLPSVGDEFSAPSSDPAKWGPDIKTGVGGDLVQTNGVLLFQGDAKVLRPWIGSYGSYTQDWAVIADVNVGNAALTQSGSETRMYLIVGDHHDLVIEEGWSGDSLANTLKVFCDTPGTTQRVVEGVVRTNGVPVPSLQQTVNTTNQYVSLRISFDAATKTLSAWYDQRGGAAGHVWTRLSSVRIDGVEVDWEMTDASAFRFAIGADSEGYAATAVDQVYADNFSVSGGVQLGAPLFSDPGNFVWARRIANSAMLNDDLALGVSVDAATNVYVAGWFEGENDFGGTTLTSYGGQDAFLARYNAAGALQWVRQAGGTTVEPVAADYWDHARGVGVDADGNVYVTGGFLGQARFDGTTLTSTNTQDFFLAKYSPAGALLWVRQGSDSDDYAYGTGVAVDAAGTSLVVGYFDGNTVWFDGQKATNTSGHHTAFIAKYNSAGAIQWARGLGGGRAYSTTVGMDAAGNCYVGGGFEGTLDLGTPGLVAVGGENGFLAKYDGTGNLRWVRQVKGPTFDGGRVGVDPAGNCFFVGSAFQGVLDFDGRTIANTNASVLFVAKYDTLGTVQWVQQALGTGALVYNEGGCAIDLAGNCYVPGVFTDSADFGGTVITNRGGWDTFVAKYDAAGNFQWVQTAGGTLDDGAFRLALDAGGTPYVVGWFRWIPAFGANLLQAQGYRDVFLARLDEPAVPLQFCCWSADGGVFRARLDGTPGARVVLLTSHDLTTWTPWQTNTLPAGGLPLAIPVGTNLHQFFRAQSP